MAARPLVRRATGAACHDDGSEEDPFGDVTRGGGGRYVRFVGWISIASLVEGSITHPFDLVKCRQQVSNAVPGSTFSYMRTVVRSEGVLGLYRGFGWSVIGGLPSEVSTYVGYTVLKEAMLSTPAGREHRDSVYLFAGALADMLSLLLWVPADLISQRLQVHGIVTGAPPASSPPSSAADPPQAVRRAVQPTGMQVARDICRTEGFLGLWRGLGATIAVTSPSSAIWWLTYERAKEAVGALAGRDPSDSVAVQAVAGSLAGAAAASITTPLDTLKSRLQCSVEPRSIGAHLADVVREHGSATTGLLRGIVPRVLANAPRSVISLVGYELALKLSGISSHGALASSV